MKNCMLFAVAFLSATLAAERPFRPPAVPLAVNDPFLSLWSAADRLTDAETTHWSGATQPLSVLLEADGKTYRLCGMAPVGIPALRQTSTEVRPLTTVCRFDGDGLVAEVRFMTPRFPEDLDVFSRPVTYLSVKVSGARRWSVNASISPAFATNDDGAAMVTNRLTLAGLRAVAIGRSDQKPLSESGDRVRCNWGWAYLAGPAVQGNEALFLIAYDDVKSVRFFGSELDAWWRRSGRSFTDMLETAVRDHAALAKRANAFDREFMADMVRLGGEKYARLGALAYRQSFGACILVSDPAGQPLMFSKENASNGCMGTVDVFYPQLPHLLLAGPTLTRATLAPIMLYASSPRWPWPFAPHDIGRYPLGDRQRYAGGETATDETSLMPVEECGNMLIALGALSELEGNAAFASEWWPTVTKWAAYLEKFGFDPGDQLCTDDFAGHLAHNANLSVKAILALACYGRMSEMRGEKDAAAKYVALARQLAGQWVQASAGGREGAARLTLEKDRRGFQGRDMWSQKYNLVWDRILGLGVFPPKVAEREVAAYRRLLMPFGLPLDNRYSYTKADWTVWSATLNGSRPDFEAIVGRLYRFADETPDRIPLSDWYWTDTSRFRSFIARSVVGGFYLPFLYDRALWRKYASRDRFKPGAYAPLRDGKRDVRAPTVAERTAGPQTFPFADESPTRADPPSFDILFEPLGTIRPKSVRQHSASKWSISLNAPMVLDWIETVPEIGIPRGRLHAGRKALDAKTGAFDFRWHDNVIARISSLGLKPLIEVDGSVAGLAEAAKRHFAGKAEMWVAPKPDNSRDKTRPEAGWSERMYAKWLLRRLMWNLAHNGRADVPLAVDAPGRETGLVKTVDSRGGHRRPIRAKTAFYAVQNAVALFDESVERGTPKSLGWAVSGFGREWFTFRNRESGAPMLVWWANPERQTQADDRLYFSISLNGDGLKDPVWVDVMSGRAYAVPPENIRRENGRTSYIRMPTYDAPVVLTERAVLDLVPPPAAAGKRLVDPAAAARERDLQRMDTPWTKAAERGEAWRSYPRPQLVRKGWTNLNGMWDYAICHIDSPRPAKWQGKIRVPYPVESTLSGVGHLLEPDERLWYRRSFRCNPSAGRRTLLHFGAVDHQAQVFVNGVEVALHTGGNVPFTVDATDFIRSGENELAVAVWDPTDAPAIGIGGTGKQALVNVGCFYRRCSGIWQTVWMEETPRTYVSGYRAVADIAKGTVRVTVELAGTRGAATVEIAVREGDRVVASASAPAASPSAELKIPSPKLWSPASPHLYDLDIRLSAAGVTDAVKGYFGMREITWRKDANGVPRLTLNGKFIYMHGLLSQGWWPDGILTPPSEDGMRFDVDEMRKCGFNVLRKHIKVEPAQFYRYCDETGMLLWQDMPSGKNARDRTGLPLRPGEHFRNALPYTSVRYADYRRELKEMMDHLSYFPSIVVWVPYNEAWGQPGEGETNETLAWAKRYDPTRLVDGPSGWNDYGVGDLRDRHNYPEPKMEPVAKLGGRRVSVLGEYGSLQYALPGGHAWIRTKRNPKPDAEMRAFTLKRYGELMDRTADLVKEGLAASIYTMDVDSELGVGGLLSYDRVPKFKPEEIRPLNERVYRAAAEAAR